MQVQIQSRLRRAVRTQLPHRRIGKFSLIAATWMAVIISCTNVYAEEVRLSFSDANVPADDGVALRMTDQFELRGEIEFTGEYRDLCNCVSHDPGHPHRPLIDRPGDRNRSTNPPRRYCEDDCERAGHPHEVAWWAKCSPNPHYSAWYVGGDSVWFLKKKTRPRTTTEGTWGLDFKGWLRPRRTWLCWSCDRDQGGTGAYATDGEPAFVKHVQHHFEKAHEHSH